MYDLSINKNLPLCEQSVSQKKRTRLTNIKINPKHKVVIVGNDRGVVSCFKLSPNLRKVPVKSKKDPTPLPRKFFRSNCSRLTIVMERLFSSIAIYRTSDNFTI